MERLFRQNIGQIFYNAVPSNDLTLNFSDSDKPTHGVQLRFWDNIYCGWIAKKQRSTKVNRTFSQTKICPMIWDLFWSPVRYANSFTTSNCVYVTDEYSWKPAPRKAPRTITVMKNVNDHDYDFAALSKGWLWQVRTWLVKPPTKYLGMARSLPHTTPILLMPNRRGSRSVVIQA